MEKPIGRRGSWFARVNGQLLPCVHEHWRASNRYIDPGVKLKTRKWEELIASLREKGLAILTSDRILQSGTFERTGYIALFEIGGVTITDRGLEFRFEREVARFQ